MYIKLSGAFNEVPDNQPTPDTILPMVNMLHPWTSIVFTAFPRRVMFGSDWPVCNVGGPKGEQGNWNFWVEIVKHEIQEFDDEERESIWWRAATEAYALD